MFMLPEENIVHVVNFASLSCLNDPGRYLQSLQQIEIQAMFLLRTGKHLLS